MQEMPDFFFFLFFLSSELCSRTQAELWLSGKIAWQNTNNDLYTDIEMDALFRRYGNNGHTGGIVLAARVMKGKKADKTESVKIALAGM